MGSSQRGRKEPWRSLKHLLRVCGGQQFKNNSNAEALLPSAPVLLQSAVALPGAHDMRYRRRLKAAAGMTGQRAFLSGIKEVYKNVKQCHYSPLLWW